MPLRETERDTRNGTRHTTRDTTTPKTHKSKATLPKTKHQPNHTR